jgi:5-methylcytosine-specific restriction endonuclease McrA
MSPLSILEFYNYRCIVKPSHQAVTVHEIIPRSQRPNDWWEFENRVPVCASCHDRIHREGASNWVEELRRLRDERLEKW